jgi:hypothetical protein
MQAYSTITIIALLAIVAHWGATKAPVFHHSYTTQRFKQADNAWLHQQCQKPEFYSHMRQHTTVCELARQAFALSPWMAGIQACFPSASNVAPAVAVWNRLLIGVVLGPYAPFAPLAAAQPPIPDRAVASHDEQLCHSGQCQECVIRGYVKWVM